MSQNAVSGEPVAAELRQLYIDLLMKSLTMTLWDARDGTLESPVQPNLYGRLKRFLGEVAHGKPPQADPKVQRLTGRDWPRLAHTMIGMVRMNNLRSCIESVLTEDIPGDFIETGVWRGGATIFMRGVLRAYGVRNRKVWVADSFEGLPPPNPAKYPADLGDSHHEFTPILGISEEQVKSNFGKYGLLDDQVCFLKGWFKDTLPTAPIEKLAIVRLDGDMYESTMDGLTNLYPKLNAGGYLILDDFGSLAGCRKAVEDYRAAHRIQEPIQDIDGAGAFWRRQAR